MKKFIKNLSAGLIGLIIGLIIIPLSTQAAEGVSVISLTGTTNTKYSPKVQDYTFFDATRWTSTAVGPSPTGTTGNAVEVYGNDSNGSGSHITWSGGVIIGSIPQTWDWTTTHSFGGSGVTIHNDGPAEWQYLRVHNVEDGIKPIEDGSNLGSWILRDSYFTAIRDDVVENDRFEPGTIQDSLFDGIYTFYSEQEQGSLPPDNLIGVDEEKTVYIKQVYVRSYPTNSTPDGTANRFAGPWFKLQGSVPHHKVVVTDSVFAIGQVSSDFKWSNLDTPSDVTWSGNNNFILWLGTPGGYNGYKPAGVTFLEGTLAINKWVEVRNSWLVRHGLPSQDFPADYNPHSAPIAQISLSATPTPPPPAPKLGDANGDGLVNETDYNIWLGSYNKSGALASGDFNADNFVDGADYVIWVKNYDK